MRSGSISLMNVLQSVYGEGNLIMQCTGHPADLCPSLAESWESNADATVWSFKIRPDVFWHDGVRFTAEDAKFWIDLASFGAEVGDAKRSPARWSFTFFVDHSEVVNGDTLQVTLNKPNFIFDVLLANYNQLIAHPRHLMQPLIDAGEVNVAPIDIDFVGLGPFRFQKYDKGSLFSVRKSQLYWKAHENGNVLPYMDGIDFFIIKDASAMDAQFRAGNLEATARGGGFILTPERENAILGSAVGPGTKIALMGQSSFLGLAFNTLRDGPFKDVRMRKAVHLWLDRDDLILVTFGGFAKPTGMFDPPFTNEGILELPGWNQKTKDADRAAAKVLMAEAGYADGVKIPMLCRRLWAAYCEAFSTQLAEMGIDAPLDLVDDAIQEARVIAGEYDFKVMGPTVANPEQYNLQPSSEVPSNDVKHEDPKVGEFFDRLGEARTLDERVTIARELEQYVAIDQVYGAWTYQQVAHQAYRDYLMDQPIPADNYRRGMTYDTTWLDQ